jgi:hypothetical protein
LRQAAQVADAVTVTVAKGADKDFDECAMLPTRRERAAGIGLGDRSDVDWQRRVDRSERWSARHWRRSRLARNEVARE